MQVVLNVKVCLGPQEVAIQVATRTGSTVL